MQILFLFEYLTLIMTIPTYEDLMLPMMKLIQDGKEYSLRTVEETLSKEFQLTDEERNRVLPSGKMTYIYNRIGWAKTSLKKAGLIEQTKTGSFKIANRGLEILKENPTRIDIKYLLKFPEFEEYQYGSKRESKQEVQPAISISNQTPEDMIASLHNEPTTEKYIGEDQYGNKIIEVKKK